MDAILLIEDATESRVSLDFSALALLSPIAESRSPTWSWNELAPLSSVSVVFLAVAIPL